MFEYTEKFQAITELRGGTTVLRPACEAMTPLLLEAIEESREALYTFLPWSSECLKDVLNFIESARKNHESGTGLHLAVFEQTSDRLLGMMGLTHLSGFSPKGEVGYWVRLSETGKGFATDALRTLQHYCRDELGFVRLDACVATNNLASQAVLRKCGFVREGLKPKAMLCHGRWLDLMLMGKLLNE